MATGTSMAVKLARTRNIESEQAVGPHTPATRAPSQIMSRAALSHTVRPRCDAETQRSGKYTFPISSPAPRSPLSMGSASPSRAANIRIRRANYAPRLLQSPARAGHITRMRDIFEGSSQHISPLQSTDSELYPQLPNISRKAAIPCSQFSKHETATYREESLCLSNNLSIAVSQSGIQQARPSLPTQNSSESWSDDSGYIVAGYTGRSTAATLMPRERILQWLMDVSPPEDEVKHEDDVNLDLPRSTDTLSDQQSLVGDASKRSPCRLQIDDDPFVNDGDESSNILPWAAKTMQTTLDSRPNILSASSRPPCQRLAHRTDELVQVSSSPPHLSLDDGDIQMSPLSPNVCIERGPSRYHSNNKGLIPAVNITPTYKPSPTKRNVSSRKENFSESIALHGNRVGTRL